MILSTIQLCRGGGMADTKALRAFVRKDVGVRAPLAVLIRGVAQLARARGLGP